MYLCYVDESGTPDIPGNTSHFVLVGISIPVWYWKTCDQQIETIKKSYNLENKEIHTAWIMRSYLEQSRIPGFQEMDYAQRSYHVQSYRKAELLRLQRTNVSQYKQTRKNYRNTESYTHLTHNERSQLIKEIATCISQWGFARLFAECVNKIHFDPIRAGKTIDIQAFEQIVSRFEQYLQIIDRSGTKNFGVLIHDNNETVAKRHTELMKQFHQNGTLWTQVKNIIETPLYVDSQLTSMVQIADLCGYALRRYLENTEEELFDLIFQRADKKDGVVVGIRHFTKANCACKICNAHRRSTGP